MYNWHISFKKASVELSIVFAQSTLDSIYRIECSKILLKKVF